MTGSSKHNTRVTITCYCPMLALVTCVLACGQSLSVELAAGASLGLALRVLLQVEGHSAADGTGRKVISDVATVLAFCAVVAGFVIEGEVASALLSAASPLLAGLVAYRFADGLLSGTAQTTAPTALGASRAMAVWLPAAFLIAVAKLTVGNILMLQQNGLEPNVSAVLIALPLLSMGAGLMTKRWSTNTRNPSLEESLLAASAATLLYTVLLTGLDSKGQLQLLFYDGNAISPTPCFYLALVGLLCIEGLLIITEKFPRVRKGEGTVESFGIQNGLSGRELEVLGALTKQETIDETASRLDISPATVATYRRRVLDKCEVSSTGELLSKLATSSARRDGSDSKVSPVQAIGALGLAVLLTVAIFPLGIRGNQRPLVEAIGRLFILLVIVQRVFLPRSASIRRPSPQVCALALLAGLLMGSGSDILQNFRSITPSEQAVILVLLALACATTMLARLDASFLTGLLLGLTALAGIGIYLPTLTFAAGCLSCLLALIAWQRERKSTAAMPAEPEALLAKSGLTPAETQVALILGRGLTAAEAADELNLSRATVATHRKSIYKKLNIHSQHELILKLAGLSE